MRKDSRAQWRHEVEARCWASGRLKASPFIRPIQKLNGPGSCGADRPVRIYALQSGTVRLNKPVLLNCPMTLAAEDWLARVVQPLSLHVFGEPVVALSSLGTYSCRRINRNASGPYSEHAFLNAMDISAFYLRNGVIISVSRDWHSLDVRKRSFLHAIGAYGCAIFTTSIGPHADSSHKDHLHLDLANRSRAHRHICKGGGPSASMVNTLLPMPQAIPSSFRR